MEELPPDSLEKKLRIGCGALAGIAVGASVGFMVLGLKAGALWAFVGLVIVVFAVLALRFGDRFWLELIEALRGMRW